ncbi:MAG: ROK family protein [Lautropia sp.]
MANVANFTASDDRPRIGVDLGGTKIEIAALDAGGAIRLRRRVATPRDDYPATVAAIAALVAAAEAELGRPGSVGVGIPGAISPASGLVKNANSTWLNGRPLRQDLEAALRRPVRVQNDANCLAVSEAVDGAAAGAHCVFAAILGTGVGAGICIGGQPLTGRQAIAGEWGHNPLPPAQPPRRDESPGPRCWCGRHGCIETWLSGPGFTAEFLRIAGHAGESAAGSGAAAATATTILERAEAGDPAAAAALARYLDRLARALGTVVNLLDPDVIVLGGGLSNIDRLYDELPLRLPAYVFSDRADTPVRRAAHGDSSGVRGAAWLWPAG